MKTQISKEAFKQLKKNAHLVSSIRTQKPIVNDRLADLIPKIPIGEAGESPPTPDWDVLQDWGIESLEASDTEVRLHDRRYHDERVHVSQRRHARRRFVGGISKDYRQVRQSFIGTYGKEALEVVGLDEPLASSFRAISEQLGILSARMLDTEMASALPEPKAGQSPIDLEVLATFWAARSQKLDQLTREIDTLINSTQESRVLLGETLKRSQSLYANVGRLQEGVYRLAGLGDLADRMRATRRSPRKRAQGAGETTPPEEGSVSDEAALALTSGEEVAISNPAASLEM